MKNNFPWVSCRNNGHDNIVIMATVSNSTVETNMAWSVFKNYIDNETFMVYVKTDLKFT